MNTAQILVTGASRGIGRAIAKKLLDQGYIVHGTWNSSKSKMDEFVSEAKNIGRKLIAHRYDASSRESQDNLIKKLSEVPLKAIVHNAGILRFENFEEYDQEIWDSVLEVNSTSILRVTSKLQHNLQDGSSVVIISSVDGFKGGYGTIAYAASKSLLENLAKSLACNMGPKGIRVNCLAPGWITTDMSNEGSSSSKDLTPLGRDGRPEEIATAASFLISEDASYITGISLVVDGGLSAADPILKEETEKIRSGKI